jgi:hypothetical protein
MSINVFPLIYFPAVSTAVISGSILTIADFKYIFFTQFDIVFLIDDSSSMAGKLWREIKEIFLIITSIYITHDGDDIDIYFLNYHNRNIS